MQPWMGILAVLVVGIGLVVYGAIWDRTTNKLRRQQLRSTPATPIPGLPEDADEPAYVQPSDLQAARPAPISDPDALAALQKRMDAAPSLPHGHMVATFATHAGDLCVLDNPLILVVDGRIDTVREILPAVERAKIAGRPLVNVATSVDEDVLHTIEVNTLARTLPGVAVALDDTDHLRQLASLVGATPVTPADLRSGWVPATSLGTCGTWVSSADRLWLLDDQA